MGGGTIAHGAIGTMIGPIEEMANGSTVFQTSLASLVMPILIHSIEDRVVLGNQAAHEKHRAAQYEQSEVTYRALLPWANLRQRAVILNNLAMLLRDQGRWNEALKLMDESVAIRRELYGERHPETWVALSNRASLEGAMGQWKQAGATFRVVLDQRREAGMDLTESLVNVALVDKLEGRFTEAITRLEAALEAQTKDERLLASIHNNLGSCLMAIGKRKAARVHLNEAVRLIQQGHPTQAQILLTLASLEYSDEKYPAAHLAVDAAEKIERKYFAAGHRRHAQREKLLAWIEFGEGNWKQAESRLHAISDESVRDEVDALELKARLALKHHDEAAALRYLEAAIGKARNGIGANASVLRNVWGLYAQLMRKQQRYADAARAEQQVITLETRSALASYLASSR